MRLSKPSFNTFGERLDTSTFPKANPIDRLPKRDTPYRISRGAPESLPTGSCFLTLALWAEGLADTDAPIDPAML